MAEADGDIFGPIDANDGNLDEFTSVVTADGVVMAADSGDPIHGTHSFKITGDGTNEGEYGIKTFSEKT